MKYELIKEKSDIHGEGIFSKSKIPTGMVFYKIPLITIHKEPKPKCARISDNRYVDDPKILNLINHSCNPNSKLDLSTDKPFLISIKEISSGEEITVNYNETEIEGIKIKCLCKSDNCKGEFNVQ